MAWADHGAPCVDEAMVDEPLEAVLAASWSVKEQTLDLVPVEIGPSRRRKRVHRVREVLRIDIRSRSRSPCRFRSRREVRHQEAISVKSPRTPKRRRRATISA